MYEESLRMPFVIRHPASIAPGTVNQQMILNVDFAVTFLTMRILPARITSRAADSAPIGRRDTGRLAEFDVLSLLDALLDRHPYEWMNAYHDPAYAGVRAELTAELYR